MPILEVCKRSLKDGVTATNISLLESFPQIRFGTKIDFVFYSSIENPADFFVLGVWPSLETYDEFVASAKALVYAPLDKLSTFEWVEFMELDSIKSLPIEAPVMTITRAFLTGGNNAEEYNRKISNLRAPLEAETKPHPFVFSWTIDTVKGSLHKRLMFVGWKSKENHQEWATWVRRTPGFEEAPSIRNHYEEGTTHNHTFNMEKAKSKLEG